MDSKHHIRKLEAMVEKTSNWISELESVRMGQTIKPNSMKLASKKEKEVEKEEGIMR